MRSILIALTVLFSGTALAQQPDLSQSGLVGKLENPTIIADPAQWPKTFSEAPALAELVKAGKLPPVEQRIPQEPMVLKPLRSVGKYGGMWRARGRIPSKLCGLTFTAYGSHLPGDSPGGFDHVRRDGKNSSDPHIKNAPSDCDSRVLCMTDQN